MKLDNLEGLMINPNLPFPRRAPGSREVPIVTFQLPRLHAIRSNQELISKENQFRGEIRESFLYFYKLEEETAVEESAVADWRARVWRRRRHFRFLQDLQLLSYAGSLTSIASIPEQLCKSIRADCARISATMACPITVTKFVGTVSLGLLTVSSTDR